MGADECVSGWRHIWTGPLTRHALRGFRHEALVNVAEPDEAGLMHFDSEQGNGQGLPVITVTKAPSCEELPTDHSAPGRPRCLLPPPTHSYLHGSICLTLTGFVSWFCASTAVFK